MSPRKPKDAPTNDTSITPITEESQEPSIPETSGTDEAADLAEPTAPDLEDTVVGVDEPGPGCCDQWPTCDHNLAYEAVVRKILDEPTVPQPSQPTVEVLEEDWTRLMALLTSVENARGEYTSAKEEASRAKKGLESAQEALERALDRIRAGKEANQEPRLPFDAPAGIPEPSPDGLPFNGIHQSDVVNDTPVYDRHMKIKETSAWLIERGWKHCDPAFCERYDEATLDSLLAWARGESDIPEIDGLTVETHNG